MSHEVVIAPEGPDRDGVCRIRYADFREFDFQKLSEKGNEQRSDPYLAVYGGRNGPKSTVSVSRKATQWTRPRLFGQFLQALE
jgi:hypothetical protein